MDQIGNALKIQLSKAAPIQSFNIQNNDIFGKNSLQDIGSVQDIGWLGGILCAEGGNSNHLWFDPADLIIAYPTAILKPVDIEHVRDWPIGTIYDSALVHIVRPDGGQCEDYREIPKEAILTNAQGRLSVPDEYRPCGIAVAMAIWKTIFADVWEEIVAGYESGSTKLSMECWTGAYAFRFGAGDNAAVVDADGTNQHLHKMVGRLVNGEILYRVARDITFCGVAKTQMPAEYRSRIVQCASIGGVPLSAQEMQVASAQIVDLEIPSVAAPPVEPEPEIVPEESTSFSQAEMQPEVHSEPHSQERSDDMDTELQKAHEEQIAKLETEKADLSAKITELEAQIAEKTAECATAQALIETSNAKVDEISGVLQAERDAVAREKRIASRMTVLQANGIVDDETADEDRDLYVARVTDMSDGDFDQMVKIEKSLIDKASAKAQRVALAAEAKALGLSEDVTGEQVAQARSEMLARASRDEDNVPPPPAKEVPAGEPDTASLQMQMKGDGFGSIQLVP